MNAPTGKIVGKLDLSFCKHWSNDLPYRAIVAVAIQPTHGTILYQVAGLDKPPQSALNALKLAITKHGGTCFYCKRQSELEPSTIELTVDHIEPIAIGGDGALSNLVVACKACNAKKGQTRIDAFNPRATKEWISALRQQLDARLLNLK
jgi:5-methylcytosine-specific restriction endonuclease McrA